MQFKLDHIVHVTDDPVTIVNDIEKLGLTAFIGGEHANWGTRNSLCHFGLPYIEFIGIQHEAIAEKVDDNTLIQQLVAERDNGFARIALHVDEMDEAVTHFKKLGLHVLGPVPGSRRQPDGKLLEWAMLFIEDGGPDRFHLPFIIDWKQTDSEREQNLINRGHITEHPAGVTTLSAILMATADAEKSSREWEKLFGAMIQETYKDDELKAHCVRLTLGQQSFIFCEPYSESPLQSFLQVRGARPFRIHLSPSENETILDFHNAQYQGVK